MRFSASALINAPPEKVFALVDDLEGWPQWIPSIKKIEKITEGPLQEGSQIRVTVKSGITIKLLMTITEFIPGQRGVLEGSVLGTKMTRFYNLESIDDGTKLTAGGDVSGLLAFLIRRGGQRLSEEIVQAAKRKIEGSGT
ncbi:MAG: SRPBCC family protein [Dehalococcoidia bacterium]|nr:MAG: SRPBCC family protein [Dehalococcoidia bacterium]